MIKAKKTAVPEKIARPVCREQIVHIAREEYGRTPPRLRALLDDVADLYGGRWPTHEACQVGYHNIDHAHDVGLAVARMVAGWHKVNSRQPLPERLFMAGLAGALFHDAGYIKEKGDTEGRGGKFTFTHVERSALMARHYLVARKWAGKTIDLVERIIAATDFYADPGLVPEPTEENREPVIIRMVATADLVSQIADINYLERIHELFKEFEEGYGHERPEKLTARGVLIFNSAREMVLGTLNFYERFVLPRLVQFGRMDTFLAAFFDDGRNPYQENIVANLSGQLTANRTQWQQLGKILLQMGVVSREQLRLAVFRQRRLGEADKNLMASTRVVDREQLLALLNREFSTDRLGEILLEMEVINSVDLCQGLLNQMLSPAMLESLSRQELIYLLQVAVLLQNAHKGSRVLTTILERTNRLLECGASSVLLADHENDEIVIVVATGSHGHQVLGRRLPMDKGLAGWVYRHNMPATVNNVRTDERFDQKTDDAVSFVTRSILAVPLHINGEWVGVIEMLNKENDRFTEHDMDIVTILVNLIGSALGNTLAFQL